MREGKGSQEYDRALWGGGNQVNFIVTHTESSTSPKVINKDWSLTENS